MATTKSFTSVTILVFLPLICLTWACNSDGPQDCDFNNRNWCGWSHSDGWKWQQPDNVQNGITWLRLKPEASEALLTSRLSCTTKTITGWARCFTFQYKFAANDAVALSVYVNETNSSRRKMWSLSSVRYPTFWYTAYVPVSTSSEFYVELEASRLTANGSANESGESGVDIDNIDYMWRRSCKLSPPDAAVTPATTTSTLSTTTSTTGVTRTTGVTKTTSTPSSTTTTMAVTTTTTTRATSRTTTSVTTSTHKADITSTPGSVTTATANESTISDQQEGMVKNSEPSLNIGAVVGGIIAALIVMIIVSVVLIILYRRNKLHTFTNSYNVFKTREPDSNIPASNNVAYNPDVIDTV